MPAPHVLVRRATLGYSENTDSSLQNLGPDAWLKRQLYTSTVSAPLQQRLQSRYPTLRSSAQFNHDNVSAPSVGHQLRAALLDHALYSDRQLFERTVWFFTDHLNVAINDQHSNFLKAVDDQDVIRRHAFGYFPQLLHASAKSAAMLAYLTNDTNVVGHPNENYARELMELHTLGIDGPYTETDVRELARCFTGWTFTGPNEPTRDFGTFRFDASAHDNGPKQVLGHTIPAGGGIADGEFMLTVLAIHPSTARHLATKLLRWFVTYDPPAATIDRVAQVYLRTNGHIPSVLEEVLSERSMAAYTPKLKQPFHYGVSLMRALGIDVQDSIPAIWTMGALRQLPFDWPAPDGYPDAMEAWVGGMLPRWHFATQVCNTWWSFGTLTLNDLLGLMQGAPRSRWAQRIDQVLTGGTMSDVEVQAVQNYLDNVQWPTTDNIGPAFEIAANSPSFQLY